jgi:hypothetical protein
MGMIPCHNILCPILKRQAYIAIISLSSMRYLSALALLLVLAWPATSMAQAARDGNIRFGKVDRPGVLIEFPYSKGITENALRARMEKNGFKKPKSDKGFISYQAAAWPDITPGQIDVYAKVDGNSKDNTSTIVMLVSKGYDNYVSTTSDPEMTTRLRTFLNALLPDIQAQQLMADIGAQEEVIRKAEREYKASDDDGNRLSREKEKIEKQMAANVADKQTKGEALAAAKARLEQLRAGLK